MLSQLKKMNKDRVCSCVPLKPLDNTRDRNGATLGRRRGHGKEQQTLQRPFTAANMEPWAESPAACSHLSVHVHALGPHSRPGVQSLQVADIPQPSRRGVLLPPALKT